MTPNDSGAEVSESIYHVVCHNCEYEGFVSTDAEASLRRDDHRRETGHDIEYAELNKPESHVDRRPNGGEASV